MKKFFKTSLTLLLTFAVLLSGTVVAFASDGSQGINPRLNVALNCSPSFTISDTNRATVSVRYLADSSIFQKATVTVRIEKRFLLVFWNEVDIGYTNNEWTASSTNPSGVLSNTFTVNGKGMYRAHITLEITGKNGQKDVIEETLEYEYK